MPPSLKKLCAHYGVPLMCRFRYLLRYEIVPYTHSVTFDPGSFNVVGKTDGTRFDIMGVGFNEEEAVADLVTSLKACMEARGLRPAQDVLLVGRSIYDNECTEVTLGPDLTV